MLRLCRFSNVVMLAYGLLIPWLAAESIGQAKKRAIDDRAGDAKKAQAERNAEPIDFERARLLLRKREQGETLSAAERTYLERAVEARRAGTRGGDSRATSAREKTGLVPLSEMTAEQDYHGEDGGLYGGGRNEPSREHRIAALAELVKVQPLDAKGQPAAEGRIVFVSISMSNATQEFSTFKRLADSDPAKSKRLTIVDCAQGGQAMAEWVDPQAKPWSEAERRIAAAGVTDQQVQIAWVKLANKGPRGELSEHGRKLQRDTVAVLHNAKARFPNLRVVYLASRIYGGYADGALNPEPYAYESAFAARWLIQDQMQGDAALNYDVARGPVTAPLLLWGPYFWADGITPRASDQLVWSREDLANDGTHPSPSGQRKVARMLLEFFRDHALAKTWF